MYISLILFFIALGGIAIMLARKIFILKHANINTPKNLELEFEVPDLDEVKEFANKKIKRYGYIALVSAVRLYIIGGSFVKNKSKVIVTKIKSKLPGKKITKIDINGNVETSPFIKTITEYKQKIKKIKHKIKKEEGIE
ncbi:MAG: hypothetical protein WC011_04095 [Candidatus Paceibacterota bacterium]